MGSSAPSNRGYLEGQDDLVLSIVLSVIRTFHKERNSTELYQEMCTIAQSGKETPQDFLFRALELRQKIIFSDKENKVKFDKNLVGQTFRQSVKTGLRDDHIRSELAPVLKRFTTDEELLQSLNDITRKAAERSSKLGKSVKVASTDRKEDAVLAELRALRVEMAELKEKVHSNSKSGSNTNTDANHGQRKPRRRGICSQCQEKGEFPCSHCFQCFSTTHRKSDCPQAKKPTISGN
jgi:hypothetical protein